MSFKIKSERKSYTKPGEEHVRIQVRNGEEKHREEKRKKAGQAGIIFLILRGIKLNFVYILQYSLHTRMRGGDVATKHLLSSQKI